MSGLKLYEISAMLQDGIDARNAEAEANDGVYDESWEEFLDTIDGTYEEKALNIAKAIKNSDAVAEATRTEENAMSARRKAAEAVSERLKRYLAAYVPAGRKICDATTVIGWRKSTVVDVQCAIESLPDEYKKIEITARRAEIKDALKSGESIPGCQLVEKQNISIK